jgi:hypothetical protein
VSNSAAVNEIAETTLRSNWVEGEREDAHYAYTRPSPGRYPWQWYWDSCFHAIAWRRFEPARAESELRSLLAAQRANGFIGHTIFWDRPVSVTRLAFYNVASRGSFTTETIQPPLLAWAWRIAVGDPREVPEIAAHHRWLGQHRDLSGSGLISIVQPDESGLDSSPKFDEAWGLRAHARIGFPLLVRRNRRVGWDALRVADAGGPLMHEVVTNVLWNLSRLAMGAPSITPALVDSLWDEERGLFLDTYAPPRGAAVRMSTWSALAPLALPDLPDEIGHRLVREQLLDPARYWTPYPPPSVSVSERSYEPRRWRFPVRRYWRGPTWVNSAWLVWIGLLRLGYESEAGRIADAITTAVAREGLREFYEPTTGAGMGARQFGWSTLACELADPPPEAARSYL